MDSLGIVNMMGIGIGEFQVYLLSLMRADAQRRAALERLTFEEQETVEISKQVERALGAPLRVENFEKILGNTLRKTKLSSPSDGFFSGSIRSYFSLPVWPELLFSVNENQDGFAWGMSFESKSPTNLTLGQKIAPWSACRSEFKSSSIGIKVLEAWDNTEDLELEDLKSGKRYIALFDLGVVQSVTQIS